MTFDPKNAKTLRSVALLAVAANFACIVLLGFALPERAQVLLPILGLAFPFLTTWLLDAAAEAQSRAQTSAQPGRAPQRTAAAPARHALT